MKKTALAFCLLALLSGCGTVKEVSAPCKRPAELTAFAEDPRTDCGAMRSVNGDVFDALAAIDALLVVSE